MQTQRNIIRIHGKAFLEEKQGVQIVHLKGDPYERGYQHGALLADKISEIVPKGLAGAAAVIAHNTGSAVNEGYRALLAGKIEALQFIPPEFQEEMKGIADALQAAGSATDFDDLVLWNTMYDSWCFYNHPDPGDPGTQFPRHPYPPAKWQASPAPGRLPPATGHPASDVGKPNAPASGQSESPHMPGCSSFSAWGPATLNGKLIFGKNMDNLALPGILENRILVIEDPDHGYGHAFVTHPGMLAIDGGINEDGIEMMTHYSPSRNETMRGCGIGTLSRLILQYAHRIDDAVNMLTVYPRCTGINYHVADAKTNCAAVIEVSATDAAVRYPEEGRSVLWSTNHYNCFPGWKGYRGPVNMVSQQQAPFQLKDVGTIDKWQQSLQDRTNPHISGSARFRRYEQLLMQHQGAITVEKGIEILGDRQDPDSGRVRAWDEPIAGRNDGATICALKSEITFAENAKCYKSEAAICISAKSGCLWSMLAVPGDGDVWIAMTDFPAQGGPYVYFNLFEELQRA